MIHPVTSITQLSNYPVTQSTNHPPIPSRSIIRCNVPLSIFSSLAVAIRFQLLRISACLMARFCIPVILFRTSLMPGFLSLIFITNFQWIIKSPKFKWESYLISLPEQFVLTVYTQKSFWIYF